MARKNGTTDLDTAAEQEAVRIISKMIAKLERLQGGSSDLTREARDVTGGRDLATRALPVNEGRKAPAGSKLCTEGSHPSPGSPAIAVAREDKSVAFCVECLLRESSKGNRSAPRVKMIREDFDGSDD